MKNKSDASNKVSGIYHPARPILRAALIVAAYLFTFIILDSITHQFEEQPGVVAWYPPAGISFAFLLVFGARFIPALAIASLISSFYIYHIHQSPEVLFLWAFLISLIYGVAAAFLRYRIRFDWHLRKMRDVTCLIFTTIFISALLAVISMSGSTMTGKMPQSEVSTAIFHWWIGETVGVLTVTPFLLIYVMPVLKRFAEGQPLNLSVRKLFPRPTLSVIGQAFSIVFMLYWVFGASVLDEFHPLYLITLPLIWIALYSGFKGITLGIVVLNFGMTIAILLFRFDLGHLGELQLLMIVNCIVGLLMGAVVSDRKQAEDSLRENEEQLKLIIDAVPALIAYMSAEQRYLYVNQAYADWYGYTKEEIAGKHASEILSEESYKGAVRNIEAVLKGQKVSFENVAYDIDGNIRVVRAVYEPQQNVNGDVKAFLALVEDITERKRAEEQIWNDLKEKELLLKEIHHRVKNNLQIIISLLRLQARSIPDEKVLKIFDESIYRIHSMSQVHELLYATENFANIPFQAYVKNIVTNLIYNYNMTSRISSDLNIQNILLPLDTAIPCGLIINEMATNSLKYAFPNDRKGVIKISMLLGKDNEYELIFQDNGIGFNEPPEENEQKTFGLQLIRMLTKQIGGNVVLNGDEGTSYRIAFPKDSG